MGSEEVVPDRERRSKRKGAADEAERCGGGVRSSLNPEKSSPNLKPSTPNPEHSTPDPIPSILNPKP
jgi:hypothetical protein